jgi:heptaprenylglycerol acetyltransferase
MDDYRMMSTELIPGDWEEPKEPLLRGALSRILQLLARISPGAQTWRVLLHRARGVRIGEGVWIGYDVVLDTAGPKLITIEDGATISIGAIIIAHFKEFRGVRIEKDAFIGPGAIILPNVVVGRGAVVKAGSVVSRSVPPMTVVEGNPAVSVAKCGVALRQDISLKTFSRNLQPLRSTRAQSATEAEELTATSSNGSAVQEPRVGGVVVK